MSGLIAAVEAGGTKYLCAVARKPDEIIEEIKFPTGDPTSTIAMAVDFFAEATKKYGEIGALCFATFGPAAINPADPRYGKILSTPKKGWPGVDIRSPFTGIFGDRIILETDVNAAAVGEMAYGAARGLDTIIYLTVGTGIGGGVLVKGEPLHGRSHPEMGHVIVNGSGDGFAGICPFHGLCLEGAASGPAIKARWGIAAEDLPDEHEAWDHEARYLAQGLADFVLCFSPEKIILGGGVMQKQGLLQKIRKELSLVLADYIDDSILDPERDDFVVYPELGQKAGIVGALEIARRAAERFSGKNQNT